MNNVEAKFILQAYRPNGADASDATFGAALEQAARDPALHAWFGREQAFDARLSAKLAQVQPPAGLREAILAGGRVTASDAGHGARRWGGGAWMALAASLAVVCAVGVALWPKQASAHSEFTKLALADADESSAHGGHGAATGALQVMLGQPTTRLGASLPVDFGALRVGGCRTVTFQGREVLEVCFNRNGVWFHCYIAQKKDFADIAADGALQIADQGTASFAKWADATTLYIVVSKTGRAALQSLL